MNTFGILVCLVLLLVVGVYSLSEQTTLSRRLTDLNKKVLALENLLNSTIKTMGGFSESLKQIEKLASLCHENAILINQMKAQIEDARNIADRAMLNKSRKVNHYHYGVSKRLN